MSVALFILAISILSVTFTQALLADGSDRADPGGVGAGILAASISSFSASPNVVYVGQEVVFFANASSTSSSSLTFTIIYDAVIPPFPTPNPSSPLSVNVTGNPGSVVQRFAYDHPGNFSGALGTYFIARVYVSDGSSNVTRQIPVYVNVNRAPVMNQVLPDMIEVQKNQAINLAISVSDPDNDTLTVTWDYGDGNTTVNYTGSALNPVFLNQSHAWNPYIEPGQGGFVVEYWLNVTVEDGFQNSVTSSTLIRVVIPDNLGPTLAFVSSASAVELGTEVEFYANASDPDGDPLAWTFVFNNGTANISTSVNSSSPAGPWVIVWQNLSYNFTEVGNYTVTAYVSDALVPNQVFPHNASGAVFVGVFVNKAPNVEASIDSNPQTPVINYTIGPTVMVMFSIEAGDYDGDVLTLTWDFGDGSPTATNASAGGPGNTNFIQQHEYVDPGSFNVTVIVTDGRPGHEVVRSLALNITSLNLPPALLIGIDFSYGVNRTAALPGEVLNFTVVISDAEFDVIEVVWDFGDGSPRLYFNLSDYVDGNLTCVVQHAYVDAGTYKITVWFTDNKIGVLNHSRVINGTVAVASPVVRVEKHWDWFDYTSLGLLLMVPFVLAVRTAQLNRRRRLLELRGMTLEEEKIRKEEMLIESMLQEEVGEDWEKEL